MTIITQSGGFGTQKVAQFPKLQSLDTPPPRPAVGEAPQFGSNLDAALFAARLGLPVIQLLPEGGSPAAPNWRDIATADLTAIREMWSNAPDCGVGTVLGGGLIALSIEGDEGGKQLDTLIHECGLPATAAARQSTENAVLLFRLPPGAKASAERIGSNIAVLTDFVELPSAGADRWLCRIPPAIAPARLIARLTQTNGVTEMGAGADAVNMFCKGQLPALQGAAIAAAEAVNGNQDKANDPTMIAAEGEAAEPRTAAELVEGISKPEAAPLPSKLDAALTAARKGFRVFPLIPNGKKPAFKGWQIRATTNEGEIRKWWAPGNRDYNIGILLVSDDGTYDYAVVDVDQRYDGHETFRQLAKQIPLTDVANRTLLTATAAGGNHFIFKLPPGLHLKSNEWQFGKGIDLKTGYGALIVAPGSTIDGRQYRWVNDRSVREMLPGLIAMAQLRPERGPDAGKRLVDEDDEAVELATAYLRRAPGAAQGNCNKTATVVAMGLYDYGVWRRCRPESGWNSARRDLR